METSVMMRLLFLVFGILIIIYYTTTTRTTFPSLKSGILQYKKPLYILRNSSAQVALNYDILPRTDYESLMNISFKFTINNLLCQNTDPLLLVLIHSAPKNFAKRKVIRETWGMSTERIKILFLLGTPDDIELETKLQNENLLYNDFLQGNFLDSYKNMTYKHMMALKYVVYHCPQAKYVLKIDDDTCVNIPTLKNFLTRDLSSYGAQNLLMCNVIYNAKPYRSFNSKWRVGFDEYLKRFYPTYCFGWYILYSPDVIFDFYREAQRTKYFWIDDVFITGIIADKLNFIGHTDLSPLTLTRNELILTNRTFLFGWADMNDIQIRSLWQHILKTPASLSVKETLDIR